MAKLITTIVVENGMDFDEICSFETETCVGIYSHNHNTFIVMEKSSCEFHPCILPVCRDLEELDNEVYKVTDEHILEVYDTSDYIFVLENGSK